MRVISTPLAATAEEGLFEGNRILLMAFDTLVDSKNLITGITVGKLDGPTLEDVRVSDIGKRIIARMSAHAKLNAIDTSLVVVAGVQNIGGAIKRVSDVLRKAPEGATVLFVCADDKVYDAAFPALRADFQAANAEIQ